ncbi:hypothetical protein PIB30_013291 [Stylosanthes scabra]|uniref:Uncharacterized protein n=1 Tax=Stylosanthes scabra TaxID=79078 RepID=A0ABU6S6Q2_9FABA|nr:hypothetical protein [Stylosanthes scabra]
MDDKRNFSALVHYTGKIKKNSRKLGATDSKRVAKLFYCAPVAVVSEHVNYGSFVVQSDADLEVIFHCRKDFPELVDFIASSGGSNPNPTSGHIGSSSSSALVTPVVPVIPPCVVSPSFTANLHHEDDVGCDLGENRTFGELVAVVANSPQNVHTGVHISEPEGIEEALRDDEDEEKPEIIGGDSDDNHPSIPAERGGPSSSGSHQYPEHFSALDLEAMAPSQEENDVGVGFGGGRERCSDA